MSGQESSRDLGDFVILLLAATLAGLRDTLETDGFSDAAEHLGDLVEMTDLYLTQTVRPSCEGLVE